MKTDDFPVSNGGEVDPCGVIISQLVLKTIPHALQLISLKKKTTVDDIEGDVDQWVFNITTEIENNAAIIAINSIHFQVRATISAVFVLTPMFSHIYGNLESK